MLDKLEMGTTWTHIEIGVIRRTTLGDDDIINHDTPDDFVLSTMETHSVRDLCQVVFDHLDLDYNDFVVQNPKYMRPEELKYLKEIAQKALRTLFLVGNQNTHSSQ